MPLENPLIFYHRRGLELMKSGIQWLRLTLQYRAIRKRIARDPESFNYTDEALQPVTAEHTDQIVDLYANKIPKTHGAPPQRPRAETAAAAQA
jgi:hypothetical protein